MKNFFVTGCILKPKSDMKLDTSRYLLIYFFDWMPSGKPGKLGLKPGKRSHLYKQLLLAGKNSRVSCCPTARLALYLVPLWVEWCSYAIHLGFFYCVVLHLRAPTTVGDVRQWTVQLRQTSQKHSIWLQGGITVGSSLLGLRKVIPTFSIKSDTTDTA